VRQAKDIAAVLKLELRIVRVTPDDAVSSYSEAVRACDLYHLPNVYCAVGMLLLGRALRADGVRFAFCGEGVNEALGDYHDWVVKDPRTGARRLLQCIDHHRLAETAGRVRYVWGREDRGSRYNAQLGSGLAKHGISRMVKPMLHCGVELECPYLDQEVMRRLVEVPSSRLAAIGGKPGFMARVFAPDIRRRDLPAHFLLESRKVRLQDASELGVGGLTPVLLQAGLDQEKTIEIFDEIFGAHRDPRMDSRRLLRTTTDQPDSDTSNRKV
jgi:asparagine synthetase B (glutamine-hydrolysing)